MIHWVMSLSGLQWLTLAVAFQLVMLLINLIVWRSHLKYHRLQDKHTKNLIALLVGRLTAVETMAQVHVTRIDHGYRQHKYDKDRKSPSD